MGKKSFGFRDVALAVFILFNGFACQVLSVGNCNNFSWSSDSQQITFQTLEGIYVMRTDGSHVRRIDSSNSTARYVSAPPSLLRIEAAHVPYRLFETNSNSAAFQALRENGFPNIRPQGVIAPAWEYNPVQHDQELRAYPQGY